MVCLYCGSKTEVTNSRSQKRRNQTWRRRHCLSCDITLTSIEAYDLSQSIVVCDTPRRTIPFSRDKLFLSLLASLGHRPNPLTDAAALCDTVIAAVVSARRVSIEPTSIITFASHALKQFDTPAYVHYAANHPMTNNQ